VFQKRAPKQRRGNRGSQKKYPEKEPLFQGRIRKAIKGKPSQRGTGKDQRELRDTLKGLRPNQTFSKRGEFNSKKPGIYEEREQNRGNLKK